jgi:hypothetical protein
MKFTHSLYALLASVTLPASAGTVLFSDNFNAPDTGNLDLSDQTGRRSGLNTGIQIRSSRVQHGIVGNQLNFLNVSTGRVRFHEDSDNNTSTAGAWFDWASGAVGTRILADGGLRFEFDWIAGNNTSANWVAFDIGHNGELAGEPGFRVNEASNDLGILFRFDGTNIDAGAQIFDNSVLIGTGTFSPSIIGLRHVVIDYLFNSFADGTPVTVIAKMNGADVYTGGFQWSGNAGQLYMELETLESTVIDNVSVSSVPEPSAGMLGAICGLSLLARRRRS